MKKSSKTVSYEGGNGEFSWSYFPAEKSVLVWTKGWVTPNFSNHMQLTEDAIFGMLDTIIENSDKELLDENKKGVPM